MVYLACDRVLDREVAFAVVNTEGADNTPRTRVPRGGADYGAAGL
jgi:hypothetical protein